MNENSQHIGANVSPLGAGGDFETQIDHGNSKPDRTTQRNVTVKPRLRQTAVASRIYLSFVRFSVVLILQIPLKRFLFSVNFSNYFLFFALFFPRVQFS